MATAACRVARSTFLAYCRPSIGEEEIREVLDSLRSGWVTTGPKVKRFEEDFASYVGARHAIAVNSCTAALHVALAALEVGPGDEVIVPTLTFCATANVVVHLGATPVVVDVDQDGQISPEAIERALSARTRAIVPVHYAGQACDLDRILEIADTRGLAVVEDAAHAVGSEHGGRKIGTHGRAVAFSFYATKNMTTGEGGMIATQDDDLAARMRLLALHGMSRDAWKRYTESGSWYYEVIEAGYKDNMTDLQAALGIHQLRRLDEFIRRRQQIAARYDAAFADLPELELPRRLPRRNHTYHLYPVRLRPGRLTLDRAGFIQELHCFKIGSSVHFIPLHRHPFYQSRYGYHPDQFPVAEMIYQGLISLPLYPAMSDGDVTDVIEAVREIVETNRI
jgi:dTDP-4-amino-4,6-dideoxygalactose transaminase